MRGLIVVLFAGLLSGCVTKTICSNGDESYRPVLDAKNSCKVRIRRVLIGTDVKMPPSLSLNKSFDPWGYEWVKSKFQDGRIEIGHMGLVHEPVRSK